MALVSIITPAYNCKNTIKGTYDSVLSQTYKDWEWIIVDDCSYFYKGKTNITGKNNLINEFLKVEKDQIKLIDKISEGANKKMYRPIISHKRDI